MENQTESDQITNPIETELETHSETDEKALIAELEGKDFNPDEAVKPDADKELALESSKMTVTVGLGIVEQGVKQFVHPDFVLDKAGVEGVSSAAAPLLVKYGGKMPPWLEPYKEEIAFVAATGMLVLGSVAQVRLLRAMDRAAVVESDQTDEAA